MEIERFVVDQIKCIVKDPALLNETVAQVQYQSRTSLAELETERSGLERELGRWNNEVHKLLEQIAPGDIDTPATARLADLQDRIRISERRGTEIREQVISLNRNLVDQQEVAKSMSIFDPVWESLTPREQTRVVQLLVERVDYDGTRDNVSITFHPTGIKTLAGELDNQDTEDAA
jgi:site-specific DNA recombinase